MLSISILNRNTVKVSYSCMQNRPKIYKVHNSKITSTPCHQLTLCDCRVKGESSIDGKRPTMEAVYEFCVTSTEPQKIYFELAERKWKQRYYNHKNSFNQKPHEMTLSSCVWRLKKTIDVNPNLIWSVMRCA